MSSNKENYKCGCCLKILQEPTKLPCNSLLCSEHTKNLNNRIYKCLFCKQEHVVPEKGFPCDLESQKNIDADSHLNECEREQKKSLNELFKLICQLFDDFQLKFNEFEYFSHEYFAEMETQIELRRERLKIQIDDISEEMIRLVKERRAHFVAESQKINLNGMKESLDKDKIDSQDKFRLMEISLQEIKDLYAKQQSNIFEIQKTLNEFENLKTKVETIAFSSSNDLDQSNFGKLIEKLDFLVRVEFKSDICEVWNIETNVCVKKFNFKNGNETFQVESYAVIQKTNLLTVCNDLFFRIYNLKSGHCLKAFKFDNSNLGDKDYFEFPQQFSVEDKFCFIPHEKGIDFYSIERECLEKSIQTSCSMEDRHTKILDISENLNVLFISTYVDENETLCLLDYDSGTIIRKKHTRNVIETGLVLPGNMLALGFHNQNLEIWNNENWECIKTLGIAPMLDMGIVYLRDLNITKGGKLIVRKTGYDQDSLESISSVEIFDTLNGFKSVKYKEYDTEMSLSIKPFSTNKFTAIHNSVIRIWDLNANEILEKDTSIKMLRPTFRNDDISTVDHCNRFDMCSYFVN